MQEVQSDNLAEVLKDNPKAIVLFGAGWCGACRLLKPKLSNIAKEQTDVTFLYVDAEKSPQSRELADIQNLPTTAGYVNSKLLIQKVGSKEEAIQEIINEVTSN